MAITLERTDVTGQSPQTKITGADGSFSFSTLTAGTYQITKTQPSEYVAGTDTVGSGAATAGTVSGNTISGIVLNSGQTATDYLFGQKGIEPLQQGTQRRLSR